MPSESPPDPLSSAERKWLAELAAVTAERDEARKEITLMGAELDEARTALQAIRDVRNEGGFGWFDRLVDLLDQEAPSD